MSSEHEPGNNNPESSGGARNVIGQRLTSAIGALPFEPIALATQNLHTAEQVLHQADRETDSINSVLAEANASVHDAMQRLADVSEMFLSAKGRLEVYSAVNGLGDIGSGSTKAAGYTSASTMLAGLPAVRDLTDRASGSALDVLAWVERAKAEYPTSIPPLEILGELDSIAGFYGLSALDETPPEDSAG